MKDREVIHMGYTYEVQNWQGLLQQLVNYTSLGYTKYCEVEYPERKRERFSAIDRKIITKYHADKSKDQRSRLKKKGFANFVFMRWDRCAWILQSPGVVREEIVYDDIFHSFTARPMDVRVGPETRLIVGLFGRNGGVSVKISKETYRDVRAGLMEATYSHQMKLSKQDLRIYTRRKVYPVWKDREERMT